MIISNKTLYKLEIWSTKYLPIIIAIIYMVNTLSTYFYCNIQLLSMIGGMSLLPLAKFYLSSFTYKLCTHHRMFIYYIFILHIIECVDFYTDGIPISDRDYLLLEIVLFGIATILYIILKRKYDFSRKYSSKVP